MRKLYSCFAIALLVFSGSAFSQNTEFEDMSFLLPALEVAEAVTLVV